MAASLVKWMIVLSLLNLHGEKVDETHPFYVSVIEINHNAKDKTLEISCKTFTNDFESALEKSFNTKVDLNNPKDKNAADKLISNYIIKHLQITIDGKLQQL